MDFTKFTKIRVTKDVKFCGETVKIIKLTVAQTEEIQAMSTGIADDPKLGYKTMYKLLQLGVEGFSEAKDSDFADMPIDELSKLSEAVMEHSGLGKAK